jgi:prepilin-type N-terminal cleavage/methylation domain-containing protein
METLFTKSFTLIEILVVIVVIGVLSAFILVGMSSITNSANIAKGQAFINSMDNALLLGRVSQWKFNEGTGATAYDSWGTNTATLKDTAPCSFVPPLKCPQWVTSGCSSESCLSFDGIDDYIEIGNPVNLQLISSFTIGLWTNTKSFVSSGIYIKKDGSAGDRGWYFTNTAGDGKVRVIISSDGTAVTYFTTTQTISTNRFVHLVAVYNASIQTLAIFFDGVSQAGTLTGSVPSSIYNSTTTVRISRFVDGLIDDIRIYNQALSTSQIQQNYYSGLNNLLANNSLGGAEYIERLSQLKDNLSKY